MTSKKERRSEEVSAGEKKAHREDKKDDREPNILHGVERRRCWGVIRNFSFIFFLFLRVKLTYGGSHFSHTSWDAVIFDCAISWPDTCQERARRSFFCLCAVKRPHKQHCAVFTGKVKKNHQGDFSCKPPGSFDLHDDEARDNGLLFIDTISFGKHNVLASIRIINSSYYVAFYTLNV